jgi:hypothetical protein
MVKERETNKCDLKESEQSWKNMLDWCLTVKDGEKCNFL